jgi:Fanconi anemia group M protein
MSMLKLKSGIKPRSYQEQLFASSLSKNTLVVLPTGLGKTLLALMLSLYVVNKTEKKVLFLAPTKPLVEQQAKVFQEQMENPEDSSFQVLTGQISVAKRRELYSSQFIFSTPQLIENDIINKAFDLSSFALVIFDECHRMQGNYAYTFIAQEFEKKNAQLIGMTASPGTSKEDILSVMQSLGCENLVWKTYEDEDVQAYVQELVQEQVRVSLDSDLLKVKTLLEKSLARRFEMLSALGYLKGKTYANLLKRDLLLLQVQLRKEAGGSAPSEEVFKALSLSASLLKVQYALELFESQDLRVAHTYLNNVFREGGDASKAAKDLRLDISFRDAYEGLDKLLKEGKKHPKLIKLLELVERLFSKGSEEKLIIFTQYRESASRLLQELAVLKKVKAELFVGQAKKGDFQMSQKDQKACIERFREGKINVLVATSVAEEGLDIPKVDSVIFYEPVASAIRSIQRMGRTGRFSKGQVKILMTEGSRDIVSSHISKAKEKKMYRVLQDLKKELSSQNKEKKLDAFFEEKKTPLREEIKEEKKEENSETILHALVDSRENTDLIKALYKLPIQFKTQQLEVGDILLSETVAIERKSKKDFINSLLDQRLFPQLLNLSKNFRRPILILEGEENIFSLRNMNPEALRSALSTIAIDLRIPILYTDSVEESAKMIYSLSKRVLRSQSGINTYAQKKANSQREEMERFVSSIPGINAVTAVTLLEQFNSIDSLVSASEKELLMCKGIGKQRAVVLKTFFSKKYLDLEDL